MTFSIIICCYNSTNVIKGTLRHVSRLELPPTSSVELIVVDNNSRDDTSAFVKEAWYSFGAPFPLLLLEEKSQGKSFALNTGVKRAKGDIVIICDDDNHLYPDYLVQIEGVFERYGCYSIFGPAIVAVSDSPFPDWFIGEQGYFAIGSPEAECEERFGYGIPGAGMVCRRALLSQLVNDQIPSLCIGPNGSIESRCDDGEICMRAQILGHRIAQTSCLRLNHFIEGNRLTSEYLDKLKREGATDAIVMTKYSVALEVNRLRFGSKMLLSTRALFKLVAGKLTGQPRMIEHSIWVIYFVSGISLFSDFQTRMIRRFISYCKRHGS